VQVETASASFGQGISVTNLQLAMATAAIANGGELMEAVLVKKVTTATGEVVRESLPRVRRRVVPAHVAKMVAELLVAVTEGEGTGVEAAIDGYAVAGKTGTAQKIDPATGRYSLDRYIASFVGFVPAEKPVIAMAVTLDEPMVEHAGGAVAAPMFRRVAKMALEARGLIPKGAARADLEKLAQSPDRARAAYAALRASLGKKPPVQDIVGSGPAPSGKLRVPDMTGLPAREALRKAYETGITPRLSGSGLLVSQTPPPGSVVDPGSLVTLVFEPAS
jgi:cell division protein FtsI (penicillin-binding protein 3)